ncbi:MAG: NAD(P)H-hydrate dehydratase [Anaerolineaceae bacterium]
MIKSVTVDEMRKIEIQADAAGWAFARMMETAGLGLAEKVRERYGGLFLQPADASVAGLVGGGNNGGDTLIALTHLIQWGWKASAFLVGRKPSDAFVKKFESAGGKVVLTGTSEWQKELEGVDVLLDGMLGTGFRLPLRSETGQILAQVHAFLDQADSQPYIVAVDCPSGVDCDSGEMAPETLPADMTVCMAAVKTGMLKLPAFERVGELNLVDIGLPEDLPGWKAVTNYVASEDEVRDWLPKRPLDAHKGTFGTALIVGGSINYTGAPLLAGEAAYRVGAGLVTMAVPESLHMPLAGALPEATWLLLAQETGVIAQDAAEVVLRHLPKVTAMLLGPGMGLEETTRDFVKDVVSHHRPYARAGMGFLNVESDSESSSEPKMNLPPLVVDADGLKHLAQIQEWDQLLSEQVVLTPHPGEMAILTGMKTADIQNHRLEVAKEYATRWRKVVVLKGAFTVIANPNGETWVIPIATSALARAGTGDVLAGIITGLLAQGMEPFHAAIAGCWLHAQAGLHAMDDFGTSASVLAGDVLAAVPEVLAELSD